MRYLFSRFKSVRWRLIIALVIYFSVRWTPIKTFLDVEEREQVRDACTGIVVLALVAWTNVIGRKEPWEFREPREDPPK